MVTEDAYEPKMDRSVISVCDLEDADADWTDGCLKLPPWERLALIEYQRRMFHGSEVVESRIQRVLEVVDR